MEKCIFFLDKDGEPITIRQEFLQKEAEMSNIFVRKSQENKQHNTFSWENLGDIKEGRGDLG
jgi:hypothetical protein